MRSAMVHAVQVSFLGAVSSYIDDKFELHRTTIGVIQFNAQKKHEIILPIIADEFAKYGINIKSEKSTFVTDEGSNLTAIWRNFGAVYVVL